jgi:hypothetical protein
VPGRSHVPTRRSFRRHHHPGRRQLDGRAGAAGRGAIAASAGANKERYAAVIRQIWGRILKAAKGAALGTGTRVEHQVVTSYWNVLPNQTLAAVQHRNLQRVGGVEYTADEQAVAERLRATLIRTRKRRFGVATPRAWVAEALSFCPPLDRLGAP